MPDVVSCVTLVALSPNKKSVFVFEQHHKMTQESQASDIYMSIYDLKQEQPRVSKAHINLTELIGKENLAVCQYNQNTASLSLYFARDY